MSTLIERPNRTAPEVTITLADDWQERMQAMEERFRSLSDDELVEMLLKKLSLTAESFAECAVLVRLAEERGIDMRPAVNGTLPILRKMAYGQVVPELVVYCQANANLFQRAAQLAIPDQRQLVQSWGLEFADGEDGSDCRMVDPRTATNQQLKQLFDHDRIRPLHEQRRWLTERKGPRKNRKVKPFVSRASDVSEDEMTASLTVAVTPEWDTAIRIMAKENGWPLKYAATRFLISLGKTA